MYSRRGRGSTSAVRNSHSYPSDQRESPSSNGYQPQGMEVVAESPPPLIIGGRSVRIPRSTVGGRGCRTAIREREVVEAPEVDEISDSLGAIDIRREEEPVADKRGKDGTPFTATCNYVRFKFEPGWGIFQYEVKFDPPVDNKMFRRKLVSGMSEVVGTTRVYDGGALLILPVKIEGTIEREVTAHDRNQQPLATAVVTLKFVREATYGRDCLNVFNLLLKRIMGYLELVQIGDRHYDRSKIVPMEARKLEIWPGYATTFKEVDGGILLMCDSTSRVLRTETVLQSIDAIFRSHENRNKQQMCQDELSGCTVMTRYNNKLYRVDEIDFEKTPNSSFERKGVSTTMVDYYYEQYHIEIRVLDQPLLVSKVKQMVNGVKEDMIILLVPELCFRTGLTDDMRSDFKLMKDVNFHTILTPARRQGLLRQYLDNVARSPEAQRVLSDWGLSLQMNSIDFTGRELPREKITAARGNIQQLNEKVDWTNFMMNQAMFVCQDFDCWIIITARRCNRAVGNFLRHVEKLTPLMGIRYRKPNIIELDSDHIEAFSHAIKKEASKDRDKLQMIVVIMPSKRDDLYSAIKRLTYAEYGIPCQCILMKTLMNENKLRGITQKIIIQMNAKLGGIPWHISTPMKGAIICGIDTYHDPARRGRSVVALVSTSNADLMEGTKWFSAVDLQNYGQEVSESLGKLFSRCLIHYYRTNNAYPDRLIVYRDGVSDSQMNVVKNFEIAEMKKVFKREGLSPKVVVIVIKKRISTKIYLKDGRGVENPPAGTVIDHTITNRNVYDFFLISQRTMQGTATPNHYVVVEDSSGWKADQIQKLTYRMCHLYFNWTGTIKVPAPCQYSHKLAYMIGQSVKREPSSRLEDTLYFL